MEHAEFSHYTRRMERLDYIRKISNAFEVHPVVALLGPRQCGKTTLARMYAATQPDREIHTFDLEDPTDTAILNAPKLALQDLNGLVVLDEIQRAPNVFEILRVLVDRADNTARFLILGSASRELIRQSSESLAGRIGHLELTPFSVEETGSENLDRLWVRGGFPPSFLAGNQRISTDWRKAYITTFLERDIPALGINIPVPALRRFWMMLAHCHGQLVNFSELGRSFGAADTTIRRYLEILSATFMVRLLPPWHENLKKRQVKAPKLYFRDSGLFHTLLGISDREALRHHPKLGPSWEGFAIESILRHFAVEPGEGYFWSAYGRAELDLLILKDGRRLGFEVEYTDSPRTTRPLLNAQENLALDELCVVFPGTGSFPLTATIRAIGLEKLTADI